jgi:hypothetical protein
MLNDIDPEKARVAGAALAGAMVYGTYTFFAKILNGKRVSREDVILVLLNVLAAALCGVTTAVIVAPVVASMIPWVSLRDLPTVGFLIGALTWELLPFAIKGARNRARREAEQQGEV